MPLTLVRAPTAGDAWDHCADAFLDALGTAPGPRNHAAWLWLTHRNLRDLLFERAFDRGLRGWLRPPISFLSELPEHFGIGGRPAGALTRRRLLARLAGRLAARELRPRRGGAFDRGPALDALFGELLPEGVGPDELAEALARLAGDGFSRRRDGWVVAVYRAYLEGLDQRGLYDDRALHARLAGSIRAGKLGSAIGGATSLHLYGIHGVRHRRALLEALSSQTDVEVWLHAIAGSDDRLDEVAGRVLELEPRGTSRRTIVQPAPDAAREHEWVAAEVKRVIREDGCAPWRVAVVARSGRHDTLAMHRALERVGVPATARVRTPLHEIAAVKALLMLFDGASRGWDYPALRALLTHPYLDTRVDVRLVDHVAHHARILGLAAWETALRATRQQLEDKSGDFRGTGLFPERVGADLSAFARLRGLIEPLGDARTEGGWIAETLGLLERDFLSLGSSATEPVGDRWDVVRLDQRGLLQLRALLYEWQRLEHGDERLDVTRWSALLRRLLESTELVLTTPMHKGVQVLEAHDAANQPFRHLFVVHANDGEFPHQGNPGSVLSDDERVELATIGLPLSTRASRLLQERALWRAVTAQDGRVTISYRSTRPDGTPLLPSLLVPTRRAEVRPELPRARAAESDPAPASAAAAQAVALARLRVTAAADGPVPRLQVGDVHGLRHALVAATAERQRQPVGGLVLGGDAGTEPGAWNGAIRDPEVLRRIAARFDDRHRWSAGALESYATCPFLFLLERVLDVRQLSEADEQTTPLMSGSVIHDLLEAFYSAVLEAPPASLDDRAEQILAQAAARTFERWEARGEWLGVPPLWAVTRSQILAWVHAYLEWELPYLAEKGERPQRLELSFGRGIESLEIEGEDTTGRRRTMRIVGRIDRIDVTDKGDLRILDYKRSSVPSRGYADGTTLQAAIYLRALESLGEPAGRARYRAVKSPGKPQNGAELKVGSADYEQALRVAFSVPDRVRSGLFEPVMSARSKGWAPWHAGPDVTRNRARLPAGRSRFDG